MKKILIMTAVAALALAGCAKVEKTAVLNGDSPIVFNTPVVGNPTKATITANTYPTDGVFDVWAFFTNGDAAVNEIPSSPQEYLTKVPFASNGASPASWVSANAYWPKATGRLSFHAISPSSATLTETVKHQWKAGATAPNDFVGFKVEDFNADVNDNVTIDATKQRDLLFSDIAFGKMASDEEKDGNNSENTGDGGTPNLFTDYKGVDIKFHHALSCIKFNAKKAHDGGNATYKITKVEIFGNNVTGTVKEGLVTAGTSGSISWSDLANAIPETTKKVLYSGTSNVITTTGITLTDNANAYIVIPHTDLEDVKIVVTYTETIGDITNTITSSALTIKGLLDSSSTAVNSWDVNKRYTYTIVIDQQEIKLDPAVVAWDDVSVTGPKIS